MLPVFTYIDLGGAKTQLGNGATVPSWVDRGDLAVIGWGRSGGDDQAGTIKPVEAVAVAYRCATSSQLMTFQ